ncbi:hypothetical protein MMPV_005611 [Pyropia vietnamensis]
MDRLSLASCRPRWRAAAVAAAVTVLAAVTPAPVRGEPPLLAVADGADGVAAATATPPRPGGDGRTTPPAAAAAASDTPLSTGERDRAAALAAFRLTLVPVVGSSGGGSSGTARRPAPLPPSLADVATVFADGALQPPWDSCGTVSDVGGAGGNATATAKACAEVDVYADRVAFAFHYAADQAYEFDEPTAMVEEEGVAAPKVVDYTATSAGGERSGGFTLAFDCQHPALKTSRVAAGGGGDAAPAAAAATAGLSSTSRMAAAEAKMATAGAAAAAVSSVGESTSTRTTLVTVALPLVTDVKAVFSLRKTCGHGVHPYVTLGYFADPLTGAPTTAGATGGVAVGFGPATPPLAVGPSDASTSLYLSLRPPGGSQEFYRPTVAAADSNAVRVDARGHVFGGVLVPGTPVGLPLVYDCLAAASSAVTVSVPLPPWEPLTARLVKTCGVGGASGLQVGSAGYDAPDVVTGGVATPTWAASVDTLATGLSDDKVRSGGGDTPTNATSHLTFFSASAPPYKDFFVSNGAAPALTAENGTTSTVSVGAPVLTVTRPDVLAVSVGVPVGQSHFYLPPTGVTTLAAGARTRLRVRLTCLRDGTSAVLVTLPTRHAAAAEWAFVRACTAPVQVRQSGFLRTASSVMSALVMLLGVAAVGSAAWCPTKGMAAAVTGG